MSPGGTESSAVKEVVSDMNVAKVAVLGVPDVPGVAAGLFSALAGVGVGADMIVQSVMRGQLNDIAFIVKTSSLDCAIEICRAFASEVGAQGVTFDSEVARVALVGDSLAGRPEIPARMFRVLAGGKINIDMIAAASTEIACIVSSSDIQSAASALSGAFLGL